MAYLDRPLILHDPLNLPRRMMTQAIPFTTIENIDYILLAQRINLNKSFFGTLNGMGGKGKLNEYGIPVETIEATAHREIFEEAQLVVKNEKLIKIQENSYYSDQE